MEATRNALRISTNTKQTLVQPAVSLKNNIAHMNHNRMVIDLPLMLFVFTLLFNNDMLHCLYATLFL